MSIHIPYMQRALTLAAKGRFTAHPNPMVGCVIVRDKKIVGEGWHQQPGTPHAEVHALQQAGESAYQSDVYVNLEPCTHTGRTPPCVDALIKAQVKRVIIPFADPNPRVNGSGIERLQQAGIEVITGIEIDAAKALNKAFLYAMQHQRPYVIAKWAMTLDGQLTMAAPHERWITGEAARLHVHQQRAQVDAIMVGANTVRVDNPQLTVRLPDTVVKQPLRVIVSSQGDIPPASHILQTDATNTWVVTAQRPTHPTHPNWQVLPSPTQSHIVDLPQLLTQLFQHEVTSVIVEGGSQLLAHFFAGGLVNEVHLYLALKRSGHTAPAVAFLPQNMHWQQVESEVLGDDIFVRCLVGSSE